ncbi:MAG TPA: ferrochelatase [Candidatus Limnocylindria bacterium]|nr:ferrochelatase [Candidatus Limnocylindria bacterium]
MTAGVLLMTYGAPRDDADLPRYLAAVRGGREPSAELITEMRRRYATIGGSPLVRITRAQANALEAELGVLAATGMRYSDPAIGDAAGELVRRGATLLVGIVMSPQWSPTLMGGYRDALREASAALGVPAVTVEAWHREPLFAQALAMRIRRALADTDATTAVVLTAHSLPRRVFEAEPEYVAQLHETAELVAEAAGLERASWHWAYQSAGHTQEEWLRPDLKEVFPQLAAAGARRVLVAPVQFLADHLEVLYDLDVAAAAEAEAAGLRYRRVPMFNADTDFIRVLAAIARRTIETFDNDAAAAATPSTRYSAGGSGATG